VVVCPRHGARFSVRTGEVLAPPAYEDVATFAVRVEGGLVQVRSVRDG
jgi:3-phenylpropionate/trans-cinnamate dioxygenase ferredoxin subunit